MVVCLIPVLPQKRDPAHHGLLGWWKLFLPVLRCSIYRSDFCWGWMVKLWPRRLDHLKPMSFRPCLISALGLLSNSIQTHLPTTRAGRAWTLQYSRTSTIDLLSDVFSFTLLIIDTPLQYWFTVGDVSASPGHYLDQPDNRAGIYSLVKLTTLLLEYTTIQQEVKGENGKIHYNSIIM